MMEHILTKSQGCQGNRDIIVVEADDVDDEAKSTFSLWMKMMMLDEYGKLFLFFLMPHRATRQQLLCLSWSKLCC